MKNKFFLKFIGVMVLLLVAYWALLEYVIYPKYDLVKIRSSLKRKYVIESIPRDEVDFLILGDSSAFYSINPKRLSLKSYSAAELGASVALVKKTFDELKIKKINKAVVLIQTFISPHYGDDIWEIFVPTGRMNLHEILNFFCSDYDQKCNLIDKGALVVKYYWHKVHFNSGSIATITYAIKNQGHFNFSGFPRHFSENLEKNNGHYPAKRTATLEDPEFFNSYWKDYSTPISPPPFELKALRELAESVHKYGVRLYVLCPQVFRNDSRVDLSKYLASYEKYLRSERSLGINYIGPKNLNLVLDRKHYRDFSHPNEDGANEITDAFSSFVVSKDGEQL